VRRKIRLAIEQQSGKKPPANVLHPNDPARSQTVPELIESGDACMLTAVMAAKMFGCSKGHVYRMAKQGVIPCTPIGNMIRFDSGSLANWLRDHELPSRY
jgi:excisionase family DNA binding protein